LTRTPSYELDQTDVLSISISPNPYTRLSRIDRNLSKGALFL